MTLSESQQVAAVEAAWAADAYLLARDLAAALVRDALGDRVKLRLCPRCGCGRGEMARWHDAVPGEPFYFCVRCDMIVQAQQWRTWRPTTGAPPRGWSQF